jgi:hypothetical protein
VEVSDSSPPKNGGLSGIVELEHDIGNRKRKQLKDSRTMMKTTAANTTDEEGELVTHDDLLEPQEQLSKLRELGAEEVKKAKVEECKLSPANYDIEHNIREIRAILRMNAEILDRCMKFRTGGGESTTSFKRIAYEVVTTRARKRGTQVITKPKRTTKEFNTTPLSKLPEGLYGIIVSSNMMGEKISSYIDFEVFFKRALLLHETVLEQFLPKLKEQLMSIQVCLGEIDAWVIQESKETINFLEETFEKKMEMPDDNVQLEPHRCSCKKHDPHEICLSCCRKYCDHYDSHYRCNEANYAYSSFQSNSYFRCEYYQVLKQCNSEGKIETTFDITNEKGKARLKKLLELMAMY